MTDQLLNILKYALLALLYLFFARVLWAVWSEVRTPRARSMHPMPGPADATAAAVRPRVQVVAATPRPPRGKRGAINRLTIIQPKARKGTAFALTDEISLGRADSCTVTIPDDAFVSTLHARVFRRDGVVYLEDLNSTNGTFLNGRRVGAAEPMGKGDRIQVGSTVLEAQ